MRLIIIVARASPLLGGSGLRSALERGSEVRGWRCGGRFGERRGGCGRGEWGEGGWVGDGTGVCVERSFSRSSQHCGRHIAPHRSAHHSMASYTTTTRYAWAHGTRRCLVKWPNPRRSTRGFVTKGCGSMAPAELRLQARRVRRQPHNVPRGQSPICYDFAEHIVRTIILHINYLTRSTSPRRALDEPATAIWSGNVGQGSVPLDPKLTPIHSHTKSSRAPNLPGPPKQDTGTQNNPAPFLKNTTITLCVIVLISTPFAGVG